MPPFKFRLEQVRRYRKQLEERAMQVLAEAVMRRDALVRRIEELEKARDAQRERLSRVDELDGAERWLILDSLNSLKLDLDHVRPMLAEAEKLVDARRADLVKKARDRGLLDSLREKRKQRHLLLERQQEQRTTDETATLRYKPAAV
jgi:flagellar FliJ protein